ncbi:MAG TPA: hypothetical protein HA300_08315 [Thermococcaceae archaeon]|nr:hypothetical protein [Thermococcaceae archaeon]
MHQELYDEEDLKSIEYLILIILGKAKGKISVLHLQKIFFFLWKFHPDVKRLFEFVPHFKGPYSSDLQEIIENPTYVVDCWEYVPPKKSSEVDKIVGGYVRITPRGKKLYERVWQGLKEKGKEDKAALNIVSAIELIVPLYTKLEWDELLLLIYTDETNRYYSTRSELSQKVFKRAESIINRLIKKGVITEDMKEDFLKRVKNSEWIFSKKHPDKDSLTIITINLPKSSS